MCGGPDAPPSPPRPRPILLIHFFSPTRPSVVANLRCCVVRREERLWVVVLDVCTGLGGAYNASRLLVALPVVLTAVA